MTPKDRPEGAKEKAILIVDHGSRLDAANEMLLEVARRVAAAGPSYHVEIAHMELASPTIEEGFAACVAAGAKEVIVHPYMLAPGRHSTEDIPRLAREAAEKHPGVRYRVTEPLGVDDRLAEVILERTRESDKEAPP